MKLTDSIKLPHKYIRLESAKLQVIERTSKAKRQLKIHKLRRQIRKARKNSNKPTSQRLLPFLQHILPLGVIVLLQQAWQVGITLAVLLMPGKVEAQVLKDLFMETVQVDSNRVGNIRAEMEAVAFFHDNEYTSHLTKGYTLPGVRLNPHLAYYPNHQVNIEAGVSMLMFNGANRYPCYAYHDIGTWKGQQYQRGAHLLPWVRLQASMKHADVILGNIYSGSIHRLSTPLFNPEQNLSADPESGAQILVHYKHFQSDTWVNWQSYIFKNDNHQEAFVVGENMRFLWGRPDSKLQWYTPIQLVIQHRGGEQDTTLMGVQTISNLAVGIGVEGNSEHQFVERFSAEMNALACYQQKGELWPFEKGIAFHGGFKMNIFKHFCFSADYLFAPKQFVTLLGNPFFGTISIKHPNTTYHGNSVVRVGIGYQRTFSKNYTLGAQAELFNNYAGENGTQPKLAETNFSFGLYFRVSPSLLIKQF